MSGLKVTSLSRAVPLLLGAACAVLALSTTATAAPAVPGPAGAPVAGPLAPALASKDCVQGGPTATDKAVAKALAGKISSPRLDSPNAGQVSCARIITQTVKNDKLVERAAIIAVTTAITESSLHDYTQADNGTSLGLYQQQTSEGWGSPAQVEDPVHSTNSFLNVMKQFYPDNKWKSGDIGAICQAVQRSADPGAYDPEVKAATTIVGKLW